MHARSVLLAGTALVVVWLATVPTALANHVSLTAEVSARVTRLSATSATIEVDFAVTCRGVGAGRANFFGGLHLVDVSTGQRANYLGGVASAQGIGTALVSLGVQVRSFTPLLIVSCSEDRSPFHALAPPRSRAPRSPFRR